MSKLESSLIKDFEIYKQINSLEKKILDLKKQKKDYSLKTLSNDYDKDIINSINLADLMKKELPPIEFLIPNIIMKSGFTVIGGDSGSFKTWLSLDIALSIISGKDFLGEQTNKTGKVLYIDEENRETTLKSRLKELIAGSEIDINECSELLFLHSNNLKLDTANIRYHKNKKPISDTQVVYNICKKFKPSLVVFDSLVRFFAGDENNAEDMRKIFDIMKQIMIDFNSSILILHHTRKDAKGAKHDLRGSGDLSAMADLIYVTTKLRNRNRFTNVKNRHAEEIDPIKFNLSEFNEGLKLIWKGKAKKPLTTEEKCERELLQIFDEENLIKYSQSSLVNKLVNRGFSKTTIYRCINNLKDNGVFSWENGELVNNDKEEVVVENI